MVQKCASNQKLPPGIRRRCWTKSKGEHKYVGQLLETENLSSRLLSGVKKIHEFDLNQEGSSDLLITSVQLTISAMFPLISNEYYAMTIRWNRLANTILMNGYNIEIVSVQTASGISWTLILSLPNKLSSASFLICFNFQTASMSLSL